MKRCFKCGEVKNLDMFYRHKQMADGHLNKCKECTKNDVKLDRINSPNAREYDKKRWRDNQDRRQKVSIRSKLWCKNEPNKRQAQNKVNNAVRDGRLIKTPCVVCGATHMIHGHHEDYSKPLDVIWLCAVHHQQHHLGTIDATKF
jgi:hypothetical protein